MSRFAAVIAAAAVVIGATAGLAARRPPRVDREPLLRVIAPSPDSTAKAHPFVNVRVGFGRASNGLAADPATFRARVGRRNVTAEFVDVLDDGVVIGKRAALSSPPLKVDRGSNTLRLRVRSLVVPGTSRRRLADTDRVRFRAADGPNQPPQPHFTVDPDLITPDDTMTFSAAASFDPDGDLLTYEWDLGDGTIVTGEVVEHVYSTNEPVVVELRASDGETVATTSRDLGVVPVVDPGRTPGTLRLAAPANLDFGAVDLASEGVTRTFTVQNTSAAAASQLRFTVTVDDPTAAFAADCPPTEPCEIGPLGQQEVTVGFRPAAAGHAQAVLTVLATASNRAQIKLVSHGYGGAGPVPWGAADPVFYFDLASQVAAVQTDGTAVAIDSGTAACEGGTTPTYPCITDADCAGGGTCPQRRCVGGTQHNAPCASLQDCPSGRCGQSFDPFDLCADGTGAVFLLNDFIHADPNVDHDPALSGTILRAGLDGARHIVTNEVSGGSTVLGCDRSPTGRVTWAQYDIAGIELDEEREKLVDIRKTGSGLRTIFDDISKVLGFIDEEGFVEFEPSNALRRTADGSAVYVANFNGLYRVFPEPRQVTPDIDGAFALFPDGSILATALTDDSSQATIRVYKLDPAAAATGPLQIRDLIPWATVAIPNNRGPCGSLFCLVTVINGAGVDSAGNVFLNVVSGGALGIVPAQLRVQGTLRIAPSGSVGISTGLVNLDIFDNLTF
jgi:hypothetical protein